MKQCPFFGKCGGCKYDFTAPDYCEQKSMKIKKLPITKSPIWAPCGIRRRADFGFADGKFGFFEASSKNIIQVQNCPNLVPEINDILPMISALPWCGAGSCLITACDNGIDIAVNANIPFFSTEFKTAAEKIPAIRITWNNKVIKQTDTPTITFANKTIEYPSGAFLQPTQYSENTIRDMVIHAADGAKHIADLFCGLGNFTFALNADGFDIVGTGTKRDLFQRPLSVRQLNQYDCVIMDPPRAGAIEQCRELAKSDVKRIIYISCNPSTFMRDAEILTRGGYKLTDLIPVDQFVGSTHWEIFSVFNRE